MGIQTDALVDNLRDHLGKDEDDLSENAALLLLNRAYWELLDKFPFRSKEVSATFETERGERLYEMPSPFEALRHLSIVDDNGVHKPVNRWLPRDYEKNYVEGEDAYGFPTNYVRESCYVRLWPTPDKTYCMVLKYWTVLADLEDDDYPGIPQSWHEIILYGAVWRGYYEAGDFDRGAHLKAQYYNMINNLTPTEAKEEEDSANARVSAPYYRDRHGRASRHGF